MSVWSYSIAPRGLYLNHLDAEQYHPYQDRLRPWLAPARKRWGMHVYRNAAEEPLSAPGGGEGEAVWEAGVSLAAGSVMWRGSCFSSPRATGLTMSTRRSLARAWMPICSPSLTTKSFRYSISVRRPLAMSMSWPHRPPLIGRAAA